MLPASPNTLLLTWFDAWCRRALRRFFYRVHLFADLRFDPDRSHLYLANHSSFWDGIVLYHWLRSRRRQPIYCMIDEVQVREHPFFRRVGGFSIDRTNPRNAIRAIDHASALLNDSPASVIVFPQGKIEHNDVRPLRFEPGVARIIDNSPQANTVTVALRYEFWKEQRAEAMIAPAEMPIDRTAPRRQIVRSLEDALTRQLDDLSARARRSEPGEILLQGRLSISRWKRVMGGGKV